MPRAGVVNFEGDDYSRVAAHARPARQNKERQNEATAWDFTASA